MTIFLKNKHTLEVDDFKFRCSIGKNGKSKKKVEGDKKTPIGHYAIENLYYRSDRIKKPSTNLKCIKIKKDMGWCDDPLDNKNYRTDHSYDLLIPIKYNFLKPIKFKGSCIFIHLTNNYKPTAGCIALKKSDFLIMLKLINKKTKIKVI